MGMFKTGDAFFLVMFRHILGVNPQSPTIDVYVVNNTRQSHVARVNIEMHGSTAILSYKRMGFLSNGRPDVLEVDELFGDFLSSASIHEKIIETADKYARLYASAYKSQGFHLR